MCVQAAADHAVSQERRNEAQAAGLQEQARQLQAAQQAWDKQHAEEKGTASQAMRPQLQAMLVSQAECVSWAQSISVDDAS